MFQVTLKTQIKLYMSNNFLVTITTTVLMSDITGNIPIIKGFQNPHLGIKKKIFSFLKLDKKW